MSKLPKVELKQCSDCGGTGEVESHHNGDLMTCFACKGDPYFALRSLTDEALNYERKRRDDEKFAEERKRQAEKQKKIEDAISLLRENGYRVDDKPFRELIRG